MKFLFGMLPASLGLVALSGSLMPARADALSDLQTQVAMLTLTVKSLQNKTTALETSNTDLKTRLAVVEGSVGEIDSVANKLAHVTVSGDGHEIYIDGANLHVRSGSGQTNGAVNGYGNLIVGYNEALSAYDFYDANGVGVEKSGGSQKTGSHNLIIGDGHSYTSYGGVVLGQNNRITVPYASVTGGRSNIGAGNAAVITSGSWNIVRGGSAAIVAGIHNIALGGTSAVLAGENNSAGGPQSAVGGGYSNKAGGTDAVIAGGYVNTTTGDQTAVGGGAFNTVSGTYSVVSGGSFNSALGQYSSITGGNANRTDVTTTGSSVTGGVGNQANKNFSTVTGGSFNSADTEYQVVP